MKRFLIFLYGIICYALFFGVFLYAIGFIGGIVVPKTIDSGTTGPVGRAILINALLLGVFAIQHSVMARPAFKRWWTTIVPKSMERSTYVLFSSLALILLFWQWQPIGGVLWSVQIHWAQILLRAIFAFGWFILLTGTFMISHAHLFGLQQIYENLLNKPVSNPKFMQPGYYKYIRHPLMLGFIIGFWATPVMTTGHLLFAAAATGYILVALQLEERDLIHFFGEQYLDYKRRVPMFIPFTKGKTIGDEQVSYSEQSDPQST
ncbi:MAG TPA: isoprenylcysteine carboxylmethyltransferase family protein [Balneolales bacterium]|nr:isoprenylcysteine carboxylmethyltransferase family protein [Balneolales bacterium]